MGTTIFCPYSLPEIRLYQLVGSLEQYIMSGEVEKCPILHVRPKFDVFTLTVNSGPMHVLLSGGWTSFEIFEPKISKIEDLLSDVITNFVCALERILSYFHSCRKIRQS